jgi:putative endopeptidase
VPFDGRKERSNPMNRKIWKLATLAAGAAVVLTGQLRAQSADHGVDLTLLDRTADPCKDFYQFADGEWLKNNPIPADRASWGSFAQLAENNRKVLREIAEAAGADTTAAKGPPSQMVGAFYRTGMDEKKVEAAGAKPLASEFARIESISNRAELVDELARLHRETVFPGFVLAVTQDFKDSSINSAWLYQGGLGMPDRDYYVSDDAKKKEIREKYLAHVAKMFELLGNSAEKAKSEASTVMSMETRLAKVSMTPVEQRDPKAIYHPMHLVDVEKLAPSFEWKRYFTGVGLTDPGLLNVAQPKFFEEEAAMVSGAPLSDWKTYLRWNVVNAGAAFLSSPFVNEDFAFFGKVVRGTQELEPRWKRVVQTIDGQVGEALGQVYVAKAFPPEAKTRAIELVANLRSALKDRIQQLDWMSDVTKQQAVKKLDAITVKIGYPDKWRDYSALTIDDSSYVKNVMRSNEFEFNRNLGKIGHPVDRTEWGMTPPTVNAYYNPSFNEIVFPAGILQPPFFDAKADDGSNYGGIGIVIGHEITHGFDDQGRQFDEVGNLHDWWTDQDSKNYNSRAEAVQKQFDAYVPIDDVHINGKLTLGENIADLGGMRISFMAMKKALAAHPQADRIGGFTPEQRFFIAHGQVWKINYRPEALRLQLATNPHSPGRFRVMGPTSNVPEFSQAFGCPAGAAGSQVTIW